MAFNYSPKIVTNGLVLCLDASNVKSYVSGSTSWNDLTSNQNIGVLTNGPTFNSSNGGSIVFDGSNDYVKLPNSSIFQLSNFTFNAWVKTSLTNTNQFIIDCSSNFSAGYGYSLRITSGNKIRFWSYDATYYLDSITTVSTNTWYNITSTYDNTSGVQKIYINGILDLSNTAAGFAISTISYLQIGSAQIFGMYLGGNISYIQFYNRALSSTEILQNYNATKTRFGL